MPSKANLFRALILGPPGSGKGTIAVRIARTFNLKHVAAGDLFRAQMASETEVGKEAAKYIKQGQLVPDQITISLVLNELQNSYHNDSWILDGFPRTLPQAKALAHCYQLDCAINLRVPDDVIVDRVKKRWIHMESGRVYNLDYNPPKVPGKDDITGEPLIQRSDDHPLAVRERLRVYHSIYHPILEFYRKRDILKEFEGRESDVIWPLVKKYLESIYNL